MYCTKLRWIAPALVLALGVAGCDEGEPTTPDTPETSLTVLLTDAVGDVDKVWVEILEMYFQGEAGRTPLPYDAGQPPDLIELTALATTPLPLIEEEEFPAGEYEQLRIVIGNAVLLDKDLGVWVKGDVDPEFLQGLPEGSVDAGELHCPSCSQSGIKVKLAGGEVTMPDGPATVVLDFDVAQSFGHVAGNAGKWVMHPTIHAVVEGGEDGPAGSITGTVVFATGAEGVGGCPPWDMDLGDFIPLATATTLEDDQQQPIVRTGTTVGEGDRPWSTVDFSIGALAPDIYDLGQGELEVDLSILTFQTAIVPSQADLTQNDLVDGIAYTVTGWTCALKTP
jgi:hypothetical protein